MTTAAYSRPDKSEYPDYCEGYVSKVPAGDIVTVLGDQLEESLALFRSIPETRGSYRYAEGKWSVKEVIGHITDGERILAYRALRFARADGQPVAGFDENAYVPAGRFNERPIASLIDEFESIRAAALSCNRWRIWVWISANRFLPAWVWDGSNRCEARSTAIWSISDLLTLSARAAGTWEISA